MATGLPSLTDRFVQLAQTPQLGWSALGIPAAETIYEHSAEMAALARRIIPRSYAGIDPDHCAEMCMAHGMSEIVAGGTTGIRKDDWKLQVIEEISQGTQPTPALAVTVGLFREYVENKTPAARLANQLDALQTAHRALRYEEAHPRLDLTIMVLMAGQRLQDGLLQQTFVELRRQRPADVENRGTPEVTRMNPLLALQARNEVIARVGSFDHIRAERTQAFTRPPYAAV